MFALVDVNSFYTSCETVWRPDLSGKPVVVLSNNDGCIVSRSAEAKALGIGMAEPYFKQKDLLQRHGVAVFSSNYALYGDMSQRVMTTLEEICPRVDQYSIDEAFVDLSGIPNLKRFGKYIRDTVYQRTMLTVGVGIGPTKTLAKLANYAAKRWPAQSKGVVDISTPARQHRLMAAIPVEEVWGIGRRLTKKLNTMNITTVLDLAKCDLWFIRKNFSVVLERTVRELRGEPCLGFQEFSPAKHEIISSRSFGQRISDYSSVREGISTWAARAAEKLRAQHQYCRYIGAFIKSSPHDPDEPYYSNSAGITLLTPTQDTRDIIAAATRSLDIIWKQGPRYQKAGVILGDFFSQGVAQLNLFDEYAPRPNSQTLMGVMDLMNKKGNKMWFAGQGVTPAWSMKRHLLSPAWTTRIEDIPLAQ
ncbi:translesion error-prone DNA polymerase V subunit UmuC [Phytobacter diazotrophicus]|uniref:translesion error-prone DNA polymerase V subunit UmuC n=1 Tax=Phytobacter diazotrophicus TaxID=395631 RepID=UPI0013EC562D|nr:translesion error-prone DNA polymerase V subunit UmuC [Phytobacter diazotrophicus]MDU7131621.1 translesion error-prone DNA polymerase V subunit UmuC [Enterobacteriaceae bacterium]QIH66606.1 DNA polymerase V subunit UmuC [Enterobacteriaceae bacterium A-F18]